MRLLDIATDAAFGDHFLYNEDKPAAMTAVLMAAARHSHDDLVDRHLDEVVLAASPDGPIAKTAAELNTYAGRFAKADTIATEESDPIRFPALLAATRVALTATHLDQTEARRWARRWLLAALRIELNPDLTDLLVRFDPRVSPLACTWFQPAERN